MNKSITYHSTLFLMQITILKVNLIKSQFVSPNFLEKPIFQKSWKSQFFGEAIFSKIPKVPIFLCPKFMRSRVAHQSTCKDGALTTFRLIEKQHFIWCDFYAWTLFWKTDPNQIKLDRTGIIFVPDRKASFYIPDRNKP